MAVAAGVTAIVTYILVTMMPLGAKDAFFSAFPKFVLIVGINLIIYIIVCRLFKLSEVNPILHRLRLILVNRRK